MRKRIIILGSTGSIGRSTLSLLDKAKSEFEVAGLSTYRNIWLLKKQVDKFKPRYVAIVDREKAKLFKKRRSSLKILEGEEGLESLARLSSDMVVVGIGGLAALRPLLACLPHTRRILLANKETIICAGSLIKSVADKNRTQIFPVDSEAWAISELLKYVEDRSKLQNVYITASGGPFLKKSLSYLKRVKPQEALKHPVWKMGKKITIDSATLMNKGFEVLEISNLFDIPLEKIKVIVHPQSVVHGFIQLKDFRVFASLFSADMKIPLSSGLNISGPNIIKRKFDLTEIRNLVFLPPERRKFPSVEMAYRAGEKGGNFPTLLVSADEEAVALYLEGKIEFLDIYKLVKKVLDTFPFSEINSFEDVFYWAEEASRQTRELALSRRG